MELPPLKAASTKPGQDLDQKKVVLAPLPPGVPLTENSRQELEPQSKPTRGAIKAPHFAAAEQYEVSEDAETGHGMMEHRSFKSHRLKPRVSWNASFVNQNTHIMRTDSETEQHNQRARTRTKARMLGTMSRHAREAKAAAGVELDQQKTKQQTRDDKQNGCLMHVAKRLGCCGGANIAGDGVFRRRWDTIQVLLLLYVAVMVPLRTGFDDKGVMVEPLSAVWWFEALVDIYFGECGSDPRSCVG